MLLAACVFFAICTEMPPVGLLPQIGRELAVSSSVAERWLSRVVLAGLLGAYTPSNVLFDVAPEYAVALVAR